MHAIYTYMPCSTIHYLRLSEEKKSDTYCIDRGCYQTFYYAMLKKKHDPEMFLPFFCNAQLYGPVTPPPGGMGQWKALTANT